MSLQTIHLGNGDPIDWPVPGAQWESTAGGTARIKIRIGHDGSWSTVVRPPLGDRSYSPITARGEAGTPSAAREQARKALAQAGYRASIPAIPQKPRKRKKAAEPVQRLAAGYYPDLLGPTEDVRGSRCGPGEPVRKKTRDPAITHQVCDDGRFHHFRLKQRGKAVAGLTLKAMRPYKGTQTATIDRVFTAAGHRRQGFASALLDEAETVFRKVKHSTDLTDVGALWKKATGG